MDELTASKRLGALGLQLPPMARPAFTYIPFVRDGDLVFLSGQGPRRPDGTHLTGKVGADVTVEQAYAHARLACLNLMAAMDVAAGGLDNISQVVKVFGMVNAVPDFVDHPTVMNGCSDLLVGVFADAGRHARSAVGMGSLPFGWTIEVEAIVRVRR